MSRPPATRYEQRLILFIDFLGFKEVVAATENDPAALRRLVSAMDEVGEIGDGSYRSQRVTQFSDSAVLSYRVDERSGVFMLLNTMALTVVTLADRGYLLRGAVTTGDLHHTTRHIVGPAMVRAYEMESKRARYPRVIIDPQVILLARRHRSPHHSAAQEEEHVRHFVTTDADGQLYFDYVSWNSVVAITGADDDGYPAYLANLSGMIERGLRHDLTNVLEKYLWLHSKYVAAIKTFAALSPDHAYRRQSFENCEFIEGLPRHERLAASAQHAVDRSS